MGDVLRLGRGTDDAFVVWFFEVYDIGMAAHVSFVYCCTLVTDVKASRMAFLGR